eukprot:s738_g6.t1
MFCWGAAKAVTENVVSGATIVGVKSSVAWPSQNGPVDADLLQGLTMKNRDVENAAEEKNMSQVKGESQLVTLVLHLLPFVWPERFYGEAKDQDINDSGKTAELFAILRGVQARREKVLVFFCRTVTSELLAALMEREFGVRPGILRGDTPHAERERIISQFKADPIPGEPFSQVLLLSVWVGAVGLNLPEARWVIHMERVWNPAMERQATSRAHRLTSRFPVKAYCLFTEDTVEARKCAVLSFKSQLSTNVMEALDADFDEGQDDEKLLKEDRELRQLICGEKSLATDDISQELDLGQDELEELANEADEGEESEEEDGKGKKKC